MSRIYAYEREPYRTELDAAVLTVGQEGNRAFAVLDDTVLFPEGGGQPADHGRLGEVAVTDVQRVEGELRHYLAAPVAPGPVHLTLDWRRRFDHMQQHTAQHLLTAVALDRYGWRTTAFHLREAACDIELSAASLSAAELEALEEAVVAEIRADRPVRARRVEPEALQELAVRSRGLPAGHRGDVRLVEIEGIDTNTCGGTHVRAIGEIETIKLLGTESLRGGTRLHWLAGGRVRRRLGEHEARAAELRDAFSTGDAELTAVARLKLGQLKDLRRRQKMLEGRLAEAVAAQLAAHDDDVVEAHFDDADMGFLQQIARRFCRSQHAGAALLTAAGEAGAFFVVAAGGASSLDVSAAGPRVAAALEARGGGSGGIFQGKAQSLAGRGAALAALAGEG